MKLFSSSTLILLLVVAFSTAGLLHRGPAMPEDLAEKFGDPSYHLLNDSIPHYRYLHIRDSLRFFNRGFGRQAAPVSAGTLLKNKKENLHYLYLSGYELKYFASVWQQDDQTIYYYPLEDFNNRRLSMPDPQHYTTDSSTTRFFPTYEKRDGIISIPVSSTTQKISSVVINIGGFIFIILAFYCLVYIPFRLLRQIARGKIFTDENIGSMYVIAWFMVGTYLLLLLIRVAGFLVFQDRIPEPIEFSFYKNIMTHWQMLVLGLVVLLFAKAFRKGYALQEENQLTV